MGLMVKVPVKDVEGKPHVRTVVERTLQDDPKNAYTIQGIMVAKFGVPEEEIHSRSFSKRKAEYNTLYSQVRQALEKLVKEGKAKMGKHQRAMVYWWAAQ